MRLSWGLIGGLNLKQDIERTTHAPGDGVNRSLKYGLIVGLGVVLSVVLVAELTYVLFAVQMFGSSIVLSFGLTFGLSIGLIGGPIAGLSFGLLAFSQHSLLRFWLRSAGLFPFRAIAFLEDAHARHLLKRVGGTYQFTHRLLLDHFADSERF